MQRSVFRAASMYLAAAWFLLQVADTLVGGGIIPDGSVQVLIFVGVIGFPLVLVGSWFLEAPWKAGGRMAAAGDIFIIGAIAVGALLFARQQWLENLPDVVIFVERIEATDLQPETQQLADHLQMRFVEFLGTSEPADLVLTGTLARGGEVLRLTMRLGDASGELLWSDTFEGALVDLGNLQLDFIAALAEEVASVRKHAATARKALDACPYPSSGAAILALAGDAEPELLAEHIATSPDNGYLYLEQSLRWYEAISEAPAHQKSVLYSLAMRGLEEAEAACPDYQRIAAVRHAYTQLESPR